MQADPAYQQEVEFWDSVDFSALPDDSEEWWKSSLYTTKNAVIPAQAGIHFWFDTEAS